MFQISVFSDVILDSQIFSDVILNNQIFSNVQLRPKSQLRRKWFYQLASQLRLDLGTS